MTERWWDDEEEKTTKETVEDLMNEAEIKRIQREEELKEACLLYTSPSPRDRSLSRMPSSA